ncbi:glutathione peroxidase [Pseudoalteromonas fenneropenaei]|uniref:Glutathione peroxidase n=1 Tax=Pseudoalteromonas fenneropenaei TaxID=1737459 RepID=A0ABV7CNS5_9GAMM
MQPLYQFHAHTLQGKDFDFNNLKDKVVLVVNTASKCGFTPQYEGLQALHEKYHQQGLVILGFPCNQFGQQEPGNAEEIKEGCLINYGVDFTMMEKIDVNGSHAHPLYTYLKAQRPGLFGKSIKWNFTKFLINKQGEVVKRYAPTKKPQDLIADIEKLLAQ